MNANAPHAVVFGAGKAACGLLGQLLTQSGYAVQFVARRPEVIEAINRRGGYTLQIAGDRVRPLAVRHCAALAIGDGDGVAAAVAEADVVFTAVGIDNLPAVSPVIAAGLWRRGQSRGQPPLNVIACENLPGAGAYLWHQVASAAPPLQTEVVERVGGFTAALTHRIMTGGAVEGGELTFTADADYDLLIDSQGLNGAFPPIEGVAFTDEFPVAVMRKLFTINLAQAVAAYVGYREGCRYVHDAAIHPRVAPVVQGAVDEARAALAAAYPHHAEAIARDAAAALERIANPRLADLISRVARGPRRKLAPRERLLGPARLAGQHDLPYDHLSLAIAAALAYDDPSDPQAVAMQRDIAVESLDKVLTEDCGLLPHDPLTRSIKRQRLKLASAGMPRKGAARNASVDVEDIVQMLRRSLGPRHDARVVQDVLGRVREELHRLGPAIHAEKGALALERLPA